MTSIRHQHPRWDDINFIRCVLMANVVVIHTRCFGDCFPVAKGAVEMVTMPAFLFLTGYLVNAEKTARQWLRYLWQLCVMYAWVVVSYTVALHFLSPSEADGGLTIVQLLRTVFITSIGPYWFLQSMIVCGACYFAVFRPHHPAMSLTSRMALFGSLLFAIAFFTPVLSVGAGVFYFLGVLVRQSGTALQRLVPASPLMLLPLGLIATQPACQQWELATTLLAVGALLSFLRWADGALCHRHFYAPWCYVGMNTLPIYLFHPAVTLVANRLLMPLTTAGSSTETGIVAVAVTVAGIGISFAFGLLLAAALDRCRLSPLLFGRQLLR